MHHEKVKILDHGYIQLIEPWGTGLAGGGIDTGSDSLNPDYEVGIIEAARQSTQGSFRGWEPADCDCGFNHDEDISHSPACASVKNPGDARLLAFLYDHRHMTPFEFAGMTIEVQAPIMVFREWHRHRTQAYNEMSARYTPVPDLYYIPTVERLMMTSTHNKQAGSFGDAILSESAARAYCEGLRNHYDHFARTYKIALQVGVPKELARLGMPVGWYSKMRATTSLRNWLQFMTLRCDPAAQWEIRQYANQVAAIIREVFPQTYLRWTLPPLRLGFGGGLPVAFPE